MLQAYAIKPVQQFAYTTGKNATDSTLIIDAMDLLYTRRFDGFCLVSSDSDFTGLALRIREEGLTVLGFGEQKTPDAFRNACHKFIFTEVLRPVAPQKTAASAPQVVVPQTPPPSVSPASRGNSISKGVTTGAPKKSLFSMRLGVPKMMMPGGSNLGAFGNYLTKIKPDFDPRLYGFKKLSELVKSMRDDLDIEERKTSWHRSKSTLHSSQHHSIIAYARMTPAAQPAVPAGRFAREIGDVLKGRAARSRQLNANPSRPPLEAYHTIFLTQALLKDRL